MKGDRLVYDAVKRASKVSHRDGKYATLSEIKAKLPTTKEDIRPVLRGLNGKRVIEKKTNVEMWRPRADTATAGQGKTHRGYENDRTDRDGGKDGGRRGGKEDGRRTGKDGRNDIGKTVARGAVSGGVQSSLRQSLF